MGLIVVENPTHLALRELFFKRFGVERADQIQPMRSLLDAGIPLALGSDGPNNPYLNIMLASVYPGKPRETITSEQAVVAYTLTAAYAEFAEKDKGSLEPGKYADLAVLSQDIFEVPPPELPKTMSVLTMVGGKIVYDKKALDTSARSRGVPSKFPRIMSNTFGRDILIQAEDPMEAASFYVKKLGFEITSKTLDMVSLH
jgi:hypothetical protein